MTNDEIIDRYSPLDLAECREVNVVPDYFIKIEFNNITSDWISSHLNDKYDFANLLQWITNNTKGRFGFTTSASDTSEYNNITILSKYICFENPEDATLFSLFYK